jgi:hypothetical protein
VEHSDVDQGLGGRNGGLVFDTEARWCTNPVKVRSTVRRLGATAKPQVGNGGWVMTNSQPKRAYSYAGKLSLRWAPSAHSSRRRRSNGPTPRATNPRKAELVLHVGRRDQHRPHQPGGIEQVALAAFDVLAAGETAWSHSLPSARLAIDPAGARFRLTPDGHAGLAGEPVVHPLPCAGPLPAAEVAVDRQDGYSEGSTQHWQPVHSTYRMPLTTERISMVRGRP